MTQEEKQLLLKDLCARLPYGVKCHFKYGTSEDDIILKCIDGNIARFDYGWYGKFHVIIDPQYIKPYLRPMSSMTEEEFAYIKQRWVFTEKCRDENDIMDVVNRGCVEVCDAYSFVDWLNANHFDYRGLIWKGLALEAPEGMYN